MPKIPFQVQEPISAGIRQEPIGQTGKQFQQLGNQLMESGSYLEQVDRAEQRMQFYELRQNARLEVAAIQDEFKDRTDYDKFEDDYKARVEEVTGKLKESVREDVWGKAKPLVDGDFQRGAINVRQQARKLRNEDLKGKALSTYEKGIKDLAMEADPQMAEIKKSDILFGIQEATEVGVLKANEAQKLIDGLDEGIDMFKAAKLIEDAQLPKDALTAYDALGDKNNFPNLDPTKRIAFMKEARDRAKDLYYMFERQEKELQEDTYLAAYGMMDDAKVSTEAKKAQLDKWTERDPITGIRPMNPSTANALKNQIDKGEVGEIDWSTYEVIRSAIAERKDVRPLLDDAIAKGKISRAEARQLLDKQMTLKEIDRREVEAEGRRQASENRQVARIEKAEEKARTAEFLRTQQDIIKDIKTYFIAPAFKDKPQIVGYMMSTIEKKVKMFPASYDLNKMRDETENLALRLIEYGNSGSKSRVLKKFEEQYLREAGLKPDIAKSQVTKEAHAAEPKGKPSVKPDKADWLKQARAANPTVSDTELSDYYDKKYGGVK